MKELLRKHPWIWLAALFLLSLVPWVIFMVLAVQNPNQPIDMGPVK